MSVQILSTLLRVSPVSTFVSPTLLIFTCARAKNLSSGYATDSIIIFTVSLLNVASYPSRFKNSTKKYVFLQLYTN